VAGVRISHPTERSATYTLIDGSRPYQEPLSCVRCGRIHPFKTYHLDLDGEGFTIVSPEVWARLGRIAGNPFTLANEVAKPPPLVVGGVLSALPRIVAHEET